jgi:hypothetical protein
MYMCVSTARARVPGRCDIRVEPVLFFCYFARFSMCVAYGFVVIVAARAAVVAHFVVAAVGVVVVIAAIAFLLFQAL